MKYQKPISFLVVFIRLFSIAATANAIFSKQGPGPHEYQSIFGQTVTIYGFKREKDFFGLEEMN